MALTPSPTHRRGPRTTVEGVALAFRTLKSNILVCRKRKRKKKDFGGAKCGPVSSPPLRLFPLFPPFTRADSPSSAFPNNSRWPREPHKCRRPRKPEEKGRLLLTLYLLTYTPCAFLLGPRRALRGNLSRPSRAPS